MTQESTDRPLGVAVIGYAFMGKAHSAAWRTVGSVFDVPAFERRVLVGRNADAVADAARTLGWAESATDWRDVVTRDDVDIVDICTPGYLHAEIAIAALQAGKHVLVEKPLANTVDEAEAMAAAAREAASHGVTSMIGFNYRRIPALALARVLIETGRLGTIRQARVGYLQDWLVDPEFEMTWRLRRETAGSGALGDLASHAVDQLQYLLGESISRISATTHTFIESRRGPDGAEPVTVDDAVWATAHFPSGAIASVEASRMATGKKNSLTIELFGSAGAIRFDLENLNELWFYDSADPAGEQGYRRILVTEPEHPYLEAWWPTGHILGWEHTFTHELRDFLLGIASGSGASPSFDDGLRVQRVLDAIETSASTDGATVTVDSRSVSDRHPVER